MSEREASLTAPPGAFLVAGDARYPLDEATTLSVREDVERVRVAGAVKPRPGWVGVDAAGHEHRWVKVPGSPHEHVSDADRVERHVPCDGSCGGVCEGEGYTVRVWVCRRCNSDVEPGYVDDWYARDVGVPLTVTREYTIDMPLPTDQPTPTVLVDAHFEYPHGDTLVVTPLAQQMHQAEATYRGSTTPGAVSAARAVYVGTSMEAVPPEHRRDGT